ncbi:MAG: two-component system response regulator [Gammaproteobacteria bacterium]|nr:MAG: two-component system response regulator [Gammaproteobacteria bacterium]
MPFNISDLYILLIEPSTTQRKFIIQHLEEAGIGSITGVVSGEEALESMANDLPDLVVSTMYFSDMTGIELVTKMREDPTTEAIPFMLISSESSFRMLEPIRQAGVIAMLPKPFTNEDLNRALLATVAYIEPGELDLELYEVENLNVLVVDDSNLARKYICNVITEMGILRDNIVLAEDGKDALSKFSEQEFDLVITDLNMPIMDGNELIEHIRNESAHPYVPIMMVTSESDNARLEHVQQAGVSAICDKPFEPAHVKQLLASIMNH